MSPGNRSHRARQRALCRAENATGVRDVPDDDRHQPPGGSVISPIFAVGGRWTSPVPGFGRARSVFVTSSDEDARIAVTVAWKVEPIRAGGGVEDSCLLGVRRRAAVENAAGNPRLEDILTSGELKSGAIQACGVGESRPAEPAGKPAVQNLSSLAGKPDDHKSRRRSAAGESAAGERRGGEPGRRERDAGECHGR